jgi:predicted HicB family RNase H-like nuclease
MAHLTENRRGPNRSQEISVRLSKELKERVRAKAAADGRPVNGWIVSLLEREAPPLLDLPAGGKGLQLSA